MLHQKLQQRMARLVPGRRLALLLRIAGRLSLAAPKHLVARLLESAHVDSLELLPDGEQRRLVEEVREIRAREAWRAACNLLEIRAFGELDVLAVQLEDLGAPLERRQLDDHLTVEAPRPQQRRI